MKRVSKHMAVLATVFLSAGFLLAGCGSSSDLASEYFDPSAELTRDDFKQGMAAQEPVAVPEEAPPIPQLQPIISEPALGAEISSRRVTVTVTETTPLKDVLIELAREARIGLELDPRIEGGVIFSAYDRPFEEVLRRLSNLAGLRYNFNDGVIRIELDDPYHVNYKLGFLNMVRSASSSVATESSVVGGGSGSSGGGGASSSSVNIESEVNFWSELESNITQILTNTAIRTGLVASIQSIATVSAPSSQEVAATAAQPPEATSSAARDQLAAITALMSGTSAATPIAAVPAPAVSTQDLAAAEPLAEDVIVGLGTGAAIPSLTPAFAAASSLFTVNRQAGIVSVFGTERQHRQVETYLRALRKSVGAQVLIEAKILEVSLDDEFRFGVNWATFFDGRTNLAAPFNTATTPTVQAPPFTTLFPPPPGTTRVTDSIATSITDTAIETVEVFSTLPPTNPITATANVLTFAFGGADLNVIANAVEQFGTVRALSSPRLTVMQNQTAVLKVAEERVFFTQEVEPGAVTDTNVGAPVITSEINTVTVGLIMTVQPSIDLDTDEITLTLRPTITRVIREIQDPAQTVASLIPELGVREIDSVVTVNSGNVVVMGGLMRDRSSVTEVGVPLLGDIPWIGQAFKSTDRVTTKTELVIFLRATIVRNDSVDDYDIKLYDQFGQDRRPLVF